MTRTRDTLLWWIGGFVFLGYTIDLWLRPFLIWGVPAIIVWLVVRSSR